MGYTTFKDLRMYLQLDYNEKSYISDDEPVDFLAIYNKQSSKLDKARVMGTFCNFYATMFENIAGLSMHRKEDYIHSYIQDWKDVGRSDEFEYIQQTYIIFLDKWIEVEFNQEDIEIWNATKDAIDSNDENFFYENDDTLAGQFADILEQMSEMLKLAKQQSKLKALSTQKLKRIYQLGCDVLHTFEHIYEYVARIGQFDPCAPFQGIYRDMSRNMNGEVEDEWGD